MFRNSVLVATALVLCVPAASAAQKASRAPDGIVPRFMNLGVPMHIVHGFPVTVMTGEPGAVPLRDNALPGHRNAIFNNINWRDKNAEWISWYGFTAAASSYSYYISSQDWYKFSITGFNALPFYGTGKVAKKIGVALEALTASSTTEFNAGIYSATASGLPGNELAGGSTTASDSDICCTQLRWVGVHIRLNAGQEYFLAVSCGPDQTACYGSWDFEDTNFKTAQDYWHFKERETFKNSSGTSTYTYSSPWQLSSAYPEQGAAIVK